jgi:hypothetical protein
MTEDFAVQNTEPLALSKMDAERIASLGDGETMLDLPCQAVHMRAEGESLTVGGREVSRGELNKAKRDNVMYTIRDGRLRGLQLFKDDFYKLVPTGGYPALEINGIRMHRTKDILPEQEASMKVDRLNLSAGDVVLDICTGLGYSCQEAAARGTWVLTLERNWQVIELSKYNPCSTEMFRLAEKGEIGIVIADAIRLVGALPAGRFDAIMHDPPTFSVAGDLYSLGFYEQLRRIIAEDGVLLHYTGQPGSKYRRRDLAGGVSKRLRRAGFEVGREPEVRSLLARPRKITDRGGV